MAFLRGDKEMCKKILFVILIAVYCGFFSTLNINNLHAQVETKTSDTVKSAEAEKKVVSPQAADLLNQALLQSVNAYMEAWQKKDYSAMYKMETIDEKTKVDLPIYIGSFDPNFTMDSWKVTKSEKETNGEYRILIIIKHKPPMRLAAMLPKGKLVSSTLIHWWKKDKKNYLHVYDASKMRLFK